MRDKTKDSFAPENHGVKSWSRSHSVTDGAGPQGVAPANLFAVGNLTLQRLLREGVSQRRLAVSQVGDASLSEAERMASAMPASGGKPLDGYTRSCMESRFGTDFGDVRIHTGTNAEESARGLDALAYTLGNNVVFGAGQYKPDTASGQRLVAHELVHVVQQRADAEFGSAPESPAMEQAANLAAQGTRHGGRRVTIEGSARVGIARWPRSLSSTLDPSLMNSSDLEHEIFDIRRWLMTHPDGSADRQLLLGLLRRFEAQLAPMTARLPVGRDDFTAAFRQEFRSVLHVFGESTAIAGPPPVTIRGEGEVSEAPMSPKTVWALFTPTQRAMLIDFILTRRIPERLFNGDENGTTTAQQRLLLSAYILANGTYRPGSFEQRVHARMCWHWVQIVHHYAGVTPATGPIAQGVMGSFDPFGGVLLGTGQAQTIFQGRPVYAEDLPTTEMQEGVGPIHAGTAQSITEAAEEERRSIDPTTHRTVHRRPALPFRMFAQLQPGDWLWYYNANASSGGSHSVIFSRWSSDNPKKSAKGLQYLDAICFSQGSPSAGGREHTVHLGDRFSPSERIYPITHVTRVSPGARPAITPLDLLPDLGPRRLTALEKENEQLILSHSVDEGLLKQWLRGQNLDCIVSLGGHLTARQLQLLEQTNASDVIVTLVRLNQRLHALVTNAEILERNTRRTFDEQLEKRHIEAQDRIDQERLQTKQKIADIDAEVGPIQAYIEEREWLLREIDLGPERRLRQRQYGIRWQQLQHLPRGPQRDELQRQIRVLREKIHNLRRQQLAQQHRMSEIKSEIRGLRRQIQPLQRLRQRLVAQQATAYRDLPYGLLHPGQLQSQDTGRTTGRLIDLNPRPPWSLLRIQTGDEPW